MRKAILLTVFALLIAGAVAAENTAELKISELPVIVKAGTALIAGYCWQ